MAKKRDADTSPIGLGLGVLLGGGLLVATLLKGKAVAMDRGTPTPPTGRADRYLFHVNEAYGAWRSAVAQGNKELIERTKIVLMATLDAVGQMSGEDARAQRIGQDEFMNVGMAVEKIRGELQK